MTYAAAGVRMDVPSKTAMIKPTEWVWQDDTFTLPIILPKWLGQVKYQRQRGKEIYQISNLDEAINLNSLRLRTGFKGNVLITIDDRARTSKVDSDGTVDAGTLTLDKTAAILLIEQR